MMKMDLQTLKLTALINGFSLLKIPLLAFTSPRIIESSEKKSVVKVGLGYRTRNHLGVMYFGSLAMGAELSIALRAVEEIQKSGQRIDFLFKNFKCDFLKRADGDVHFVCEEADLVGQLIHEAKASSERMERTYKGHAIVPSRGPYPVMTYELTLSVRRRG